MAEKNYTVSGNDAVRAAITEAGYEVTAAAQGAAA